MVCESAGGRECENDRPGVHAVLMLSAGKHITEGYKKIKIPFRRLHEVTASFNYSAGIYKDGYRTTGKLEQIGNLLIFDFDDGTPIEETAERFKAFQSTCLIVTSKSHMKAKRDKPACERYRLLIPLSAPLNVEIREYTEFYVYFAELTGISNAIDSQCKDCARFYFPNPSQEVRYIETGRVFETAALIENFRGWKKMRREESDKKNRKQYITTSKTKKASQKNFENSKMKKNELPAETTIETKQGTHQFRDFEYLQVDQTVPCRCPDPAHEDRNPSAFVGRSKESGNLLVTCKSCGAVYFMHKEGA